MNRTYSIIYNNALGEYQVASEKTKTRRSKTRKLIATMMLGALLTPVFAQTIIDTDPAVVVSSDNWVDYIFKTTATTDQFFPANWASALHEYLANIMDITTPNDSTLEANWKKANEDLSQKVNVYINNGKGYLKVDTDQTFSILKSTVVVTKVSNNDLVTVSVTDGATLTYTPFENAQDSKMMHLFQIENGGTLVMNTDANSYIEFKDFHSTSYGSSIIHNNKGNVYLGSGVTFKENSVINKRADYADIIGPVIHNQGKFYLGSNVTFSGNSASVTVNVYNSTEKIQSFIHGGAIYNDGDFYLDSGAIFDDNSINAVAKDERGVITYALADGGALYNKGKFYLGSSTVFKNNSANSTAANNSISQGGAIYNNSVGFYLGSDVIFNNNSTTAVANTNDRAFATSKGGAIYNEGNFYVDSGVKFSNNSANANSKTNVSANAEAYG